MGERTVSSINGLGKLDSHMQQNETGTLSYTPTKVNSKWIKDLAIRPETIQLLDDNIGGKLDASLGDEFLNFTPKANITKTKINRGNMPN